MSTQKQTKIDKAKQNAPVIPPNTCPYIDHIIEVLDDIETKSSPDEHRISLIKAELEYIRSVNEKLRENGKYWYEQFKKIA